MCRSPRLLLLLTVTAAAGCNMWGGGIPEPDRVQVHQLAEQAKTELPAESPSPSDQPEPMATILAYPDWNLGQTAADALGRIGAPAVPGLLAAFDDLDPARRRQAARVLARIGPEAVDAVPTLIDALHDSDPLVQKLSARALGQMGPDAAAAVPDLIELLGEE